MNSNLRHRNLRRYQLWLVKSKWGWLPRAYELTERGEYKREKPPIRLEKKLLGICMANGPMDARRAADEIEQSLPAEREEGK